LKFYFSFFVAFFIAQICHGQMAEKISVSFIPVIRNQPLLLHEPTPLGNGDTLIINKLKFYVSHIKLYKSSELIFKDDAPARLMDVENVMMFSIENRKHLSYDMLEFGLGVDSLTNVSGAQSGDLDPLKGMYWTWQSGYVNFKLEGILKSQESKEQVLEYHLGGYQANQNAYQTVSKQIDLSTTGISIFLDLSKFLSNPQVLQDKRIMTPGKKAIDISASVASCFKLK
jgi:hypothetical protein